MKELINFTLNNTAYQVTDVQPVDSELYHLRSSLLSNGKEAAFYYAGKVLKSGKVSSKQGGMFYRFIDSGSFVRVH